MSEMKILSPLRRWHVLTGLCQELGAKHLVEVGAKEGSTTGFLLDELPDLRVTAIDPWRDIGNDAESYRSWNWNEIETKFWSKVGIHKDRVTMVRETSLDAAKQVGECDIVFIDAAHDEQNVVADIKAWWPKVRAGGYVCGHDYQHTFPGVHRAVAKCFPLLRVIVLPDSVWCVVKDTALKLAA